MGDTGQVESISGIREVGDTTIVQLNGEVDMRRMPETHAALIALCARQPARLVLNLERVVYLDSSGLGMLIELFRRVRGYEGRMVLSNVPDQVYGLFQITHLDKFFPMFATEAEALSG